MVCSVKQMIKKKFVPKIICSEKKTMLFPDLLEYSLVFLSSFERF